MTDKVAELGKQIAQYVKICIEFKNEDVGQGAMRVAEIADAIFPGFTQAYLQEMRRD